MKKRVINLLILFLIPLGGFSQESPHRLFSKSGNRLIWENAGEVFWIESYGPNTLRFRSSKSLHISDQNWNILSQPQVTPDIEILAGKAIITNGKIRAEIREYDGLVTYYDAQGHILLKESEPDITTQDARKYKSKGSDRFGIELRFDADQNEHLYGMGQYQNDCLDLKGSVLELQQRNKQISIPFLLSSKGYGFIWNNPSVGQADFSMTHTRFTADYAKQIDYFIFAEDSPADLERHYANLTGKSPMMPAFATGLWQSKLRYASQDELLAVAREYKKRDLPISVIVADYFHWAHSGDWDFDPKFWPDPVALVNELDSMGIKLMVSVWPVVESASENYPPMLQNNYLIRTEEGINLSMAYRGGLTYVDVTNPDARHYMWDQIHKNYYREGVRMFWLDEAEPEIEPPDVSNIRYFIGNGAEMSSIYPFYFAQTLYEGQKQAGQDDVINLIRSAWIGSQRFGTVLWSGDILGTFKTLRMQLKAGLNISLCGIPWWTTDIGGFYFAKDKEEQFHDLMIRWFQFATFCPVMRMHGDRPPRHKIEGALVGSGADNEIWSYGEDAYEIMSHYLKVRERLRPYILKNMEIASKEGLPVMRPLFIDFPSDPASYSIDDQYMFGPDLMIAPILEYKAVSRKIYFPAGSEWKDALTGKIYKGGQTVDYKVNLMNIPVFSRNRFDFTLKEE